MEISVKLFAECLKKNKQDILKLSVYDLNDTIVGQFYDFLQIDKAYAGRTFNKRMGHLTSCIKWYSETFDAGIKNYFEKVPRKTVNYHPEIISKDEFESLLERINHTNGFIEYKTGVKKIRNVYRPWLKDGLRLALETGIRREEVINLKYSDVAKDEKGNGYIIVEDYKVNRIQGRKLPEEKKYIYIPLTQSLNDLLEELKTENHKETDFILAPNLKIKRNRIMSDILSRGFSHYYNQLITGRQLTFKSLRKTYITSLDLFTGGNAREITGHSTNKVLNDHHTNKKAKAKAAKGFKVFETVSRQNQLKAVRTNSMGSKIEKKGIEK